MYVCMYCHSGQLSYMNAELQRYQISRFGGRARSPTLEVLHEAEPGTVWEKNIAELTFYIHNHSILFNVGPAEIQAWIQRKSGIKKLDYWPCKTRRHAS
jgi:hypothetical protein